MNRRLTIKRETLAELTSAELTAVAGGQGFTGYYPTFDYPCTPLTEDLLTGTTTTS